MAPRLREISDRLGQLKDDAYVAQIRRLVPGIKTRGVRVPQIRALVTETARTADVAFEQACAILDGACEGGWRDDILFGVFLVARFRKPLQTLPWTRLAGWLKAVDNWETCDQLAMNIGAPRVAADASLTPKLLALTRSSNVWQKRFALATAAALNQRGRSMPELTLEICAPLVTDPHPMVQKALGWAIREASERDEAAAHLFLARHQAKMSRTVVREASQKLTDAHRKALLTDSRQSRED
jgi:3-methyladenine DNA glycosylase AlkD